MHMTCLSVVYCLQAMTKYQTKTFVTVKILKFGTPQTIAIIVIKNSNIALMHPKDADGMANSVDPDQTASEEAV